MSLLAKTNDGFPSVRGLLNDFFDADKFFLNGFLNNPSRYVPATNVKESDKQFELEVAAPGFEKQDFKVEVEKGVLRISAEKKQETNKNEKNYTRQEFSYSSFSRSFVLPDAADENQINAGYKDGVLTLTIPKKENSAGEASKKQINIA
jgi:HSP20 family protein